MLAEGPLEEAIKDVGVEVDVEWMPFELRPHPQPTLRPEDEYLPSIWERAVYPMARRLGVDITLPAVSPQPYTALAFEGYQYAAEHGLGTAYNQRMFRAFFQENQDLGQIDVLVALAGEIGLDEAGFRAALADGTYRARHQEALREAAAHRVQSVPPPCSSATPGSREFRVRPSCARRSWTPRHSRRRATCTAPPAASTGAAEVPATHPSMLPATHPALKACRFAGLELCNRYAVAPMTRVSATEDGRATQEMAAYYAAYAEGGFGLLITEGTYTDRAFSQGYLHQPGITDEAQAAAWRPVVERAHAAGARVVLQLMHAGAVSQGNRFRDRAAGPSAVRPLGEQLAKYRGTGPWPVPMEMTRRQIAEAVHGFAAAAVRARDAGFDGVEIHAANGYLLDQFLTPYTNLRTDEYGGGVEERLRLVREVTGAVRDAAGSGFPVGVRLSQGKINDPAWRWPGGDAEAEAVFTAAASAGADYLHLAGSGRDWFPEGRTLPALARSVTGLPVIANGGLHQEAVARRVLDDGHADVLAVGTGALANPDLPRRVAAGTVQAAFDPRLLEPLATLDNARAYARA
ncbi:DsbA family protein [Streptomyces sp. S1A(2023)]